MAGEFLTTFLPELSQSAAMGGAGYMGGKAHGEQLKYQLQRQAMLDALRQMQVMGGLNVQGQRNQLLEQQLAERTREATTRENAPKFMKVGDQVYQLPPPAAPSQHPIPVTPPKAASAPTIDPDTLKFMASQALAGDTTVFTNIGRGRQSSENLKALREEITKQAKAKGVSGKELAAINAEFFGIKSGARTLGTRTANIEMAVSEAQQMAPLALQASAKVDRTQFPTLNAVLLAAEKGTGDENVVRLAVATNSLINIYARAINPTGVPTVSDKEHARELLGSAWSQGQYGAGVQQMMLELAAARQAPGIVRKEFREAVTGGGEVGKPSMPQTGGPPVGTVKGGYRFKGGDPAKQENWVKQ